MYESPGGCDHFEWVDDFLGDQMRLMVVSLIVSNERLVQENGYLQRMKKEVACDGDSMKT